MVSQSPLLKAPEPKTFSGITNSTHKGQTDVIPKVNQLVCDKISITCPLDKDVLVAAIENTKQAASEGWCYSHFSRLYKHAFVCSIHDFWDGNANNPVTFRLDLDSKLAGVSELRIELNPAKVNVEAVGDFCQILIPHFCDSIKSKSKVTRCDLAVDVGPIAFNDIGITVSKCSVSQAHWGTDGVIETMYWGASKSFTAYDKVKESTPIHEVPKGDPPPTTVRFEARLKPENLKFEELNTVTNPFDRFLICGWPGFSDLTGTKYWFALFLDSARQRGLKAAMMMLPEKERKTVRRRLKKYAANFWDPKTIWLDYPAVVSQLTTLTHSKPSLHVAHV